MINQAEKINVLNYNENKVSVMVSPTDSFTFEPSVDGEIPSVIPMTFEQIRYANNYNLEFPIAFSNHTPTALLRLTGYCNRALDFE